MGFWVGLQIFILALIIIFVACSAIGWVAEGELTEDNLTISFIIAIVLGILFLVLWALAAWLPILFWGTNTIIVIVCAVLAKVYSKEIDEFFIKLKQDKK